MSNKTKWIIGGVLAFVLVLGCCLYFIPKTTPIDITVNAVKTEERNGEKFNDLGTVEIHVHGTLREYLFRPSQLSLAIDDFDHLYDIHAYKTSNYDISYPNITVELVDETHQFEFAWASSTVTGEKSVILSILFSSDLKSWNLFTGVSPSFHLLEDDAMREDPSFHYAYRGTVE